jgi:hypothetical protein
MAFWRTVAFWTAVGLPTAMLWSSCKTTKYTCPAYQSAFVLDLPTYKRTSALDSMEKGADTSLDVDVVAVLAERIRKVPALKYEYEADSTPIFPPSGVIKTRVLLIKKISRRRKDKLMASVPMITVFPTSPDSTGNQDGEGGEEIGKTGTKSSSGNKDPNKDDEVKKKRFLFLH